MLRTLTAANTPLNTLHTTTVQEIYWEQLEHAPKAPPSHHMSQLFNKEELRLVSHPHQSTMILCDPEYIFLLSDSEFIFFAELAEV